MTAIFLVLLALTSHSSGSSSSAGSSNSFGSVSSSSDEITARHVALQTSVIDTRVAPNAFESASFTKYLAKFDSDTRQQFIVNIKSPTQQFKAKIGTSTVSLAS